MKAISTLLLLGFAASTYAGEKPLEARCPVTKVKQTIESTLLKSGAIIAVPMRSVAVTCESPGKGRTAPHEWIENAVDPATGQAIGIGHTFRCSLHQLVLGDIVSYERPYDCRLEKE